MERYFDEELKNLRKNLQNMGGIALSMINDAVEALFTGNESLIKNVTENEQKVNHLHIENDEKSIKLLALHQPAATDLRAIAAIMKINGQIERIADQAVNISQTTYYHVFQNEPCKIPEVIKEMGRIAKDMLEKSMKAFAEKDVELARSILVEDTEEDKLKEKTFTDMMEEIKTDPVCAEKCVDFILISRNLEKIADHCTNIAEDIIFMILGKDIRHHAKEEK